jgi:NADH-quinone oxidoreductase subunit G
MASIIIDNKSYTVDPSQNLLEAAISSGLDLPYFCWHPALGSVGSCRQCAVQQFANPEDQKGRMVMACMTPVKDGARFSIDHPTCSGFRKSVIEWLMINHPHDCPVCDEGGECHLQDMTLMTGHNYRRHRFSKRTYQNQNLGPFINHEMNRCITCYRCVRYYQDIAGGTDLSAFASSGRVYFGRFENGSLESSFSGNLVEVCPTGVFTDKVYHQHYTRKWDLETAPSICQLCSLGCNISPGARTSVLRRVQNRYHHDINGFFICDKGRFGHELVNAQERITTPLIKDHGKHTSITLTQAKERLSALVHDNAVGIGSPRASLEANWALKEWVGADNFYDGQNQKEAEVVAAISSIIMSNTVSIASLNDVRESDCIIILGEDVANTAPIMALSIRQAAASFKEKRAQQDIDVARWQDAAVQNYTGTISLPIFIAAPYPTDLDSLATLTCTLAPYHVQKTGLELLKALKEDSSEAFIKASAKALKQAKKPVIISGHSLGDKDLVNIAAHLAQACDQENGGNTKLALVLPEANSMGLSMLKPKTMGELSTRIDHGHVSAAIVLENDLLWRLGEKQFSALEKGVKNLVVIDSLLTDSAKRASMTVPVSSFAENTGTLISSEGRLQRYFSVFRNPDNIESSFHLIASCMGSKARFDTIDDVAPLIACDLNISKESFDELYHANLKVLGKGIARQTPQASGRTALNANITMHEQKPPTDPDSPLVYSMEGARKKIPLPLISSYSEPGWNSLQAEFKKDLGIFHPSKGRPGGVRLFDKSANGVPLPHLSAVTPPSESSFPKVLIIPGYHIFASMERAKFSKPLASRIPLIEAQISKVDAEQHKLPINCNIIIETAFGKYAMRARCSDLPPGMVVLPFGLIDPAVFFEHANIRMVNEECV